MRNNVMTKGVLGTGDAKMSETAPALTAESLQQHN